MRPVVFVFNLHNMGYESCRELVIKSIKKQSAKHGGTGKLRMEKESPEFVFQHFVSNDPVIVTVDAMDDLDREHRNELAEDILAGIKSLVGAHRTISVIVRDPNGQGIAQLSVR